MKIIDCFPFFDEFLILDIRLKELYDVVDKFIIVESLETFSGIKKPLYLSENISKMYPQYMDKIDIIVAPENSFYNDAWSREYYQKNHICRENLEYLKLKDDDIIMFSDADEIPRRSVIQEIRNNPKDAGAFDLPVYYYKLNILTSERYSRSQYIKYKYFTNHTHLRYNNFPEQINNAGWHFSYLKDAQGIKNKIMSFSHQEFNLDRFTDVELISERINTIKDLFDRPNVYFSIVGIDETYPIYVLENIDKLKNWIV